MDGFPGLWGGARDFLHTRDGCDKANFLLQLFGEKATLRFGLTAETGRSLGYEAFDPPPDYALECQSHPKAFIYFFSLVTLRLMRHCYG